MKNSTIYIIAIIFITLSISSCGDDPIPKPRGYYRIDLPPREYQSFDTNWPYRFEIPLYAQLVSDESPNAEQYWADVRLPRFNASIHLSYKTVDGNLAQYSEDARKMAMQHMAKSTAIREYSIARPEANVYGLIYDIRGSEAASPYQFFVTDSSSHFLRGALYFNHAPNNDSLAPVISFLEEDILHLLRSLEWE